MPRLPIPDTVHQERRLGMIKAAKKLFTEKGYDGTTVDDITNELGYNKATFYHHFKTKSDILEAVVDDILSDMKSAIETFCSGQDLDAVTKLNSWFQLHYDTTTSTKKLWLSYYAVNNTALHYRLMKKSIDVFAPLMAEILQEGIEKGQFNAVPPLETAGAILYMFDFVVTEMNKVTAASETERLYDALLSIISQITGVTAHIIRKG